MTWWRRLRTTWRSERGTQPLDYVGVTGVAMVVAGMIIVGIVAARGQLGAQMARVHAHIIASFEQGRGGTINHNHWIELPPRPGFTPVQPGWRVPGAPIGEQLPPGQPVNTTPPGGWPWDRDEGGNGGTPPAGGWPWDRDEGGNGGTPPAGGWPWDRDEGGNGGTSPGGWPWDRDEGGTSPNPGIGSIVPPTNRNRECLDHVEIEIPTWDGGNECWPIWRPVALLDPSVVLPGLQPPTTQRP
nr:hypothetical protein [Chloroflexaceae bacterium]